MFAVPCNDVAVKYCSTAIEEHEEGHDQDEEFSRSPSAAKRVYILEGGRVSLTSLRSQRCLLKPVRVQTTEGRTSDGVGELSYSVHPHVFNCGLI